LAIGAIIPNAQGKEYFVCHPELEVLLLASEQIGLEAVALGLDVLRP
jgi:hypothetical protein